MGQQAIDCTSVGPRPRVPAWRCANGGALSSLLHVVQCCRVFKDTPHSPGDCELANLLSIAALVPHGCGEEILVEGACANVLDLGKQIRQTAAELVTLISTLAAGHLHPVEETKRGTTFSQCTQKRLQYMHHPSCMPTIALIGGTDCTVVVEVSILNAHACTGHCFR